MHEHFNDGNETPYVTEANKFVQYGFYTSLVGDVMPLAMATFSQASVVIITTETQRHPMYVTPVIGSAERTIFLIYSSSGPGHDTALPYSTVTGHDAACRVKVERSCRCGVNKGTTGMVCTLG